MTESPVELSKTVVGNMTEETPIRVLHVDDDASFLKTSKTILEMQGLFQVENATSIEEATEKMKKKEYDAIISDYQMPGKNGLEFLRELRQKGNAIPFVLFTGKGREEVAIKALNLGADGYFNKTGQPETVYGELAHGIRQAVQRNKAEEALRQSEEKYRNLFENAKDVIVLFDLKANVTSVNKAAEEYGFNKSGMLGKNMLKFVSKRYWPKLLKDVAQIALGKTAEGRIEIHTPKGDKMAEYRSNPIFSDNRIVGIQTILGDITERKKAEEALGESEEKYKDLFENAMDVILTLDLKGSVTTVNNSVLRFGYKKEDLIGKNILDFVSKEYWPTIMRDFSQVTQGEPAKNETELVVPTGKILVEYHARAIAKESNVTGVQINLRDVTERKKAEQRIKESEERFRQVSDNAQEWIWEVDSNGLYTFASPVVTKILGYRPEEIVGKKHFYDLFVPEERKVLKKAALQVFAQKQPFTRLVNSNLHKNGNTVVLETSGTPILDSQGMLLGYRGVDTDITERKNAEKSLRESENKFKALFEKAGEGLVYLDLKGKIVDVNQRATEIAGIERDKLMGRSFMKLGLVSLRDVPMLLGRLKDRLEGDTSQLFELTIRRKNGEKRSIEASSTKVQKNNRPIGYLAIVRDVTERKKAEQSIVESHQKFAALFSGNPEATVYTDPNMHILDINPRFIRLFGYSLEEVKGKRLDDIVVPESLVEEGKMLGEKAVKGLVYHDTFRMKKDGSLVPVSVSAAPISIQGHLAGYIATYKDISELKKTEKELKETLRRLEVMNEKLLVVGGLTRHDARNKLTAIIGNTYLVKKKVPEDSAVSEYLEEIETSVKQTTAIFEFAKTYESLGVEDLKYIDVEKTIDEAVTLMPDLKGVRIINQCGGLTVLADSLLRQLFYNLIDNSLKYGEKIRQIKASYEETSQGQLKLVYEDDGVGIQFDAKPKLFSRGYTTGKGSGYGLYLIKKMMEVYGWTIEEKGKPGEGARFVIKMPKTSESGKTGYALR